MGLYSDASESNAEIAVPLTIQAVLRAKTRASTAVRPSDLHRPGSRNLTPRERDSPRKGFNGRPRGRFSRVFFYNRRRCVNRYQ